MVVTRSVARDPHRRGHDGVAGRLGPDEREEAPGEPAVGRAGAERPAFQAVGLRGGQEEVAVARTVHDHVGAAHDPFLAEQRQPVWALPGMAAIVRKIETRRPGVGVLHADGHGEVGVGEIDRVVKIGGLLGRRRPGA